jgi:preprotein translocase subunit SecF
MSRLTTLGNDLYTGAKSIDFVGRRKLWYSIAAIVILICAIVPFVRGGFLFGIEFRGGSEFQISQIQNLDPAADQPRASETVTATVADAVPRVSVVGNDGIRVQTDQLTPTDSNAVRDALANEFGVTQDDVSASFIGPSWGADVTGQALRGLVIFIVFAAVMMALYFRTWKMSLAALVALAHDLIITVGLYGVLGFEITPAAVIGFLTILGYSLYDTVVVFDKIRENTAEDGETSRRTFAQSVNLAVNQTLVRSINTSVVAALPVAAILFIGAAVLGAGTLRDISLALFIGILVGAYSTIFIAAPVYAQLRENEPEVKKQGHGVKKREAVSATTSGAVR